MSFKRAKVVMLPTNKKAKLYLDNKEIYTKNRIDDSILRHNLYIVSDDEIKEGDWYIDDTEEIRQSFTSDKDYWEVRKDYKKIIATTDKLPTESYQGHFEGKDCTDYLPQPSQAFIEKYVEQYNKGNQIIDVLVEYEEDYDEHPEILDNPLEKWEYLKISKDNTITIKKVKDSFSRDEVEVLLFDLAEHYAMTSSKGDIEDFKKWIEENL